MSFSAIKDQDRAIGILKSYIMHSCMQGGYLFCGPEGVGKKTAARALAQALNCAAGGVDACGECASCMKIEKNQHPDVRLVECEDSDIKIDGMRRLQREISFRPYEGRKKVSIIDNAHNLTAEASGALLKILEEPPKDTLIILVSDKPALLFKTIVSRCKIVKFSTLAREKLKAFFRNDCRLDNDTAHFLAYFSEGRLGCALRLKGADILSRKNEVIDEFAISRSTGIRNLPSQDKKDLRRYMNILAAWFRDIYLLKSGMDQAGLINFDRREELIKQAEFFSIADLNRIIDAISQSVFYLQRNINVKLLLYNLKAQLCRG